MTSSMGKVPPEVWDKIIARVDDNNTWVACTRVSRLWNALATPHLFRRFGVDIVPSDKLVRSAKQADPSLTKVHTPVTLFTHLMVHQTRSSYIHTLVLLVAEPGGHSLDPAYGFDPASLCAILNSLPNLERLALGYAFLNRPVRLEEVGLAPKLRTLTCIRWDSLERASRTGSDILNIVTLFKGCNTLNIVSCFADGPPASYTPRSVASHHQRVRLDIRAIHFVETRGTEHILEQLAPLLSTLTELTVEWLTHSTLLWLKAAAEDLCRTLRVISLTGCLSDVYPSNDSNGVSAFGLLTGYSWPHLEEVMLSLILVPRGSSEEAWRSSVELLRPLTATSCPTLKRISISIGHSADEYGPQIIDQTSFGANTVFSELEDILVGHADDGHFMMLSVAVWTEPSDPSLPLELHDTRYDPLLRSLFPRLYTRGLLVLRDFTKDQTDRIMQDSY